jgi:hypothetical protein
MSAGDAALFSKASRFTVLSNIKGPASLGVVYCVGGPVYQCDLIRNGSTVSASYLVLLLALYI